MENEEVGVLDCYAMVASGEHNIVDHAPIEGILGPGIGGEIYISPKDAEMQRADLLVDLAEQVLI